MPYTIIDQTHQVIIVCTKKAVTGAAASGFCMMHVHACLYRRVSTTYMQDHKLCWSSML